MNNRKINNNLNKNQGKSKPVKKINTKKSISINKNSRNKKLAEILKFLLILCLLSSSIHIISLANVNVMFIQKNLANICSYILNYSGFESTVETTLITIKTINGHFAGTIDWDCTGWKSIFAFIALLIATPSTVKKKVYGLLLIPILLVHKMKIHGIN